jgi:TPR repeat protein
VHWFRLAAEIGDAAGQMSLASCLQSGHGVAKDEVKALEWFRKAAAEGLAEAEFNVGKCFQNGLGTAVNEEEALIWFMRAAEKGLPQGEYETGLCFRGGRGTNVDMPEALAWLTLAARRGIPNAREMCEELKGGMTPAEIEESAKRMDRLAPAHSKTAGEKVELEPETNLKFPSD